MVVDSYVIIFLDLLANNTGSSWSLEIWSLPKADHRLATDAVEARKITSLLGCPLINRNCVLDRELEIRCYTFHRPALVEHYSK